MEYDYDVIRWNTIQYDETILLVNKKSFSTVEKFMNVPTIQLKPIASSGYPPLRIIFYTMFNVCSNLEELHLYDIDLYIDLPEKRNFSDIFFEEELLIKFILQLKVVNIIRSYSHILPDLYNRISNSTTNLKKMRIEGMSHIKINKNHLLQSIKKINRLELFECQFTRPQFYFLFNIASYGYGKSYKTSFLFDKKCKKAVDKYIYEVFYHENKL